MIFSRWQWSAIQQAMRPRDKVGGQRAVSHLRLLRRLGALHLLAS
jgi:hypothetical protein